MAPALLALLNRILPARLQRFPPSFAAFWKHLYQYLVKDRVRLARVGVMSIFIWLLHLVQIWFFILALGTYVPFVVNLALAPLAIFAGLFPFVLAGIGSRDAAAIALYGAYLDFPKSAVFGLLLTMRYLLPALAGIPFLSSYLSVSLPAPAQPVSTEGESEHGGSARGSPPST